MVVFTSQIPAVIQRSCVGTARSLLTPHLELLTARFHIKWSQMAVLWGSRLFEWILYSGILVALPLLTLLNQPV